MTTLYLTVPCYNEEEALPQCTETLLSLLDRLRSQGTVSSESRILYIDDGSADRTWEMISALYREGKPVCGISLSENRGHQNALTAGLATAAKYADVTVSLDADLQDDPEAIFGMLKAYEAGYPIVCGVRSSRESDSVLKRMTAHGFYAAMKLFGAPGIYDHADFRLMSREAVERLLRFGTEDLYLRGLAMRLDLPLTTVEYVRSPRTAGESKYTLKKMLHLARRGFQCARMRPDADPASADLHIREALLP